MYRSSFHKTECFFDVELVSTRTVSVNLVLLILIVYSCFLKTISIPN